MTTSPLQSSAELKDELPLPNECQQFIEASRQTVREILSGRDPRYLLIIGPCSIHDLNSASEYAIRLEALAQRVSRNFFVVMRTYFEKPRTSRGWKGFINDPFLDGSCDLASGLRLARELLLDMAKLRLPVGCELLEIATAPYLADLLSWGCIGARTSSSQPHRQLASGSPFAVGFKNPPDGDLLSALHGIDVAADHHVFLGQDSFGRPARISTGGNPHCHLVLRGHRHGSNFDPSSISYAIDLSRRLGVDSRLVVDCSHDNCKKQYPLQKVAFESVLLQILNGNTTIGGMMLESHLLEGSQPITRAPDYRISVTDSCMGWSESEQLVVEADRALTRSSCGSRFAPTASVTVKKKEERAIAPPSMVVKKVSVAPTPER